MKLISCMGPVPGADLSPVRRDFLEIIQGGKLAAPRRDRILPLQPNELVQARSPHWDVFDLICPSNPLLRNGPKDITFQRTHPRVMQYTVRTLICRPATIVGNGPLNTNPHND
jgi:hypothetical protein